MFFYLIHFQANMNNLHIIVLDFFFKHESTQVKVEIWGKKTTLGCAIFYKTYFSKLDLSSQINMVFGLNFPRFPKPF